jgi:hypothetical protein
VVATSDDGGGLQESFAERRKAVETVRGANKDQRERGRGTLPSCSSTLDDDPDFGAVVTYLTARLDSDGGVRME